MPHLTPDRDSLDRIRPASIFVNRSNLIRLPCGRIRRWPGSTRDYCRVGTASGSDSAVKEIGADRVLYGSDFTINDPAAVIARVRNAFLTAEDREKILFRNVERLLANAGAKPQR